MIFLMRIPQTNASSSYRSYFCHFVCYTLFVLY